MSTSYKTSHQLEPSELQALVRSLPLQPHSGRDDSCTRPSGSAAPITAVWSEQPVIALAADGWPRLIVPADRCPHRDDAGRPWLPRAVRAHLRELSRHGARYPRLALVHDLDPRGPVAALSQTLHRTPVLCSDAVAAQVLGPLPTHPGVTSLARALDRGAGAVGGAAARARAGARSALETVLLDPVVLGVSTPNGAAPEHGEWALWHPLVAWWW